MATHSRYSCLENSMNRGAWQVAIPGVVKGRTQLSKHTVASNNRNIFSYSSGGQKSRVSL